MLIIHDTDGYITSLQLEPETSELPHIVVSDDLFDVLQPYVTANIQLVADGENFRVPSDIDQLLLSLTFDSVRQQKLDEIEAAQTFALREGVPFDFGDTQDFIQTRFERDLINISGITMRGLLLRGNAVADAVIEFRAQSNTSYMITPDQAIALGEAVAQHNEAIYSKAWALKDAIAVASTVAQLETLTW